MQVKIYRNITGAMVAQRAPRELRDEVAGRNFKHDKGSFTLLVFSMSGNTPIFAGRAHQALKDLPPDERLIVFGPMFSMEALAALRARPVDIFASSDALWSEESWLDIHGMIAAPKRYPVA